jgi:hypothetical protein
MRLAVVLAPRRFRLLRLFHRQQIRLRPVAVMVVVEEGADQSTGSACSFSDGHGCLGAGLGLLRERLGAYKRLGAGPGFLDE